MSVARILAAPELTSAMDMRTPGIAAPDSPLTVPVIDPPATCALVEGESDTKAVMATTRTRTFLKAMKQALVHELSETIS